MLVAGPALGLVSGIALGLVSGIGAGIAFGRGKKIPKQMASVQWRQLFRRRPLVVGFLAEIVIGLVLVPAALSGPGGTALGLVAALVVGFMAWLGAGLVAGMSRPGIDNISPLKPLPTSCQQPPGATLPHTHRRDRQPGQWHESEDREFLVQWDDCARRRK